MSLLWPHHGFTTLPPLAGGAVEDLCEHSTVLLWLGMHELDDGHNGKASLGVVWIILPVLSWFRITKAASKKAQAHVSL